MAGEVVDATTASFLDERPDIAFNHISWAGQNRPRGFGAEVVSRERLDWLDLNTTAQCHREHVTLHLYERADQFRLLAPKCPRDLDPGVPNVALDVDLPEHIAEVRQVCAGATFAVNATQVMAGRARLAPAALRKTA